MKPSYMESLRELGAGDDAIEAVLSRVAFGVFVDHVEKGCIYANAEVLRMFGLTWEQFQGFGWAASVMPEDMESMREAIERYEIEKTWIEVQYRISVPDGSIRVIHVVGKAILDAAGDQRGSVMIGREVTSERAARDRTIQQQKLEAIGRLASRVAHDFNNVLTPIMFSAALLGDEDLSPDGTELLGTINQSVEHAAAITGQLLGLARTHVHERYVSSVDAELHGMKLLVGQLLGESIRLALDLQAPGATIGLAPHEFSQVVLNLCVNARDAAPASGAVHIKTSLEGQFVEVTVSDDGAGMAPDVKERVFDAFFTTKSADRGTGLGLFTAKDLVDRAGGTIGVESELGVGTTVRFRLPSVAGSAIAARSHSAPAVKVKPSRVLLVDDNSALRQTLAYVLALRGHHVKSSADLARARDLLGGEAFDVLVLDVMLPDGVGPDLVGEARTRNPGISVVYMSGFTGDALHPYDLDGPRTAFLAKPFHPNELTHAMAEALADEAAPVP